VETLPLFSRRCIDEWTSGVPFNARTSGSKELQRLTHIGGVIPVGFWDRDLNLKDTQPRQKDVVPQI
jgi:hypothetical protein